MVRWSYNTCSTCTWYIYTLTNVIRYDSNSGGTREIQRTMLELLNQLDGFDERGDVKVIMATNKIESLDPALIRPGKSNSIGEEWCGEALPWTTYLPRFPHFLSGRIDRKIEFPLPDIKTKRRIFGIHTGRMTLSEDVDLEIFIMAKDELSGADIKVCVRMTVFSLEQQCLSYLMIGVCMVSFMQAVCTEAGLLALRERRMKVTQDDFVKAKEKALYRKKGNIPEGLYL